MILPLPFNWDGRPAAKLMKSVRALSVLVSTLKTLLAPVVRVDSYHFYERDLSQPIEPVVPRIELDICRASQKDIDALAGFDARPHSTPEEFKAARKHLIKELLLLDRICILGKSKGEIVHEDWILFDWDYIEVIGLYFVLDHHQSTTQGVYTASNFRKKAIHTSVKYHMLTLLKETGYQTDYCYIHTSNIASHTGTIRNGYKVIGTLYAFEIKGLKRPIVMANRKIRSFLRVNLPA